MEQEKDRQLRAGLFWIAVAIVLSGVIVGTMIAKAIEEGFMYIA